MSRLRATDGRGAEVSDELQPDRAQRFRGRVFMLGLRTALGEASRVRGLIQPAVLGDSRGANGL